MDTETVIAIGFAAASTALLLFTFFVLRRTYARKITEASRVLGITRNTVAQLEREGQLPGALGLGNPVAISPKALEVLRECRSQAGS